jgi:hypothetical protein
MCDTVALPGLPLAVGAASDEVRNGSWLKIAGLPSPPSVTHKTMLGGRLLADVIG